MYCPFPTQQNEPGDAGRGNDMGDILSDLDRQMWDEMEIETEEDLSRHALYVSESALSKAWDDPEEDEAWADL
jgi:hypothetical protein